MKRPPQLLLRVGLRFKVKLPFNNGIGLGHMQTFIKKAAFGCALLAGFGLSSCAEPIHKFEGVEGPLKASPIFQPIPANPSDYGIGETSRLAILLTEENSQWLGLASGFKTIGIPFRFTDNVEDALSHDVVLVYPHISGRNMTPKALRAMRKFVDNGGTLIGTNVLGGGMSDMFGFDGIEESKSRYALSFQSETNATKDFDDKDLAQIKIGSAGEIAANPGTNSYLNPANTPLAIYENGQAAIITNKYGQGTTYALGIDLGQILAKGYNRRQVDIAEYYANNYQPTLDALLILMENIYKDHGPKSVTLGTVPDGQKLSFILSHDVDFSESLENSIAYAQHQKDENISATYFIQTKYVRDYNDKIFMDKEGAKYIQELEALGAEIASHSVAHSNAMWDFKMGDGTESYPDYKPFVQTAKRTKGATIMGELRVSKFLLDNFVQSNKVESFRPGFLSNPSSMPEALTSSGYKYSSSSTANVSLTHLPFQLTHGRGFEALTPIFEFPITIEDELPPVMIDRLDDGVDLARKIAKIEGLYVVLIHTDDVDKRLRYQKEIVKEVRPYAWMGSVREFGDWWSARNQVTIDVTELADGNIQLKLNAPTEIRGLTLELRQYKTLVASSMPMENIEPTDAGLLLTTLSGAQTITLSQ